MSQCQIRLICNMVTILVSGFLVTQLSSCFGSVPQNCITITGEPGAKSGVVGESCKFPFLYKNTWINGCKKMKNNPGNYWCPTKIDGAGKHIRGNWGLCGSNCRLEGDSDCPDDEICMDKDLCPLYQEIKKIKRKNKEYPSLIQQLQQSVCNKKQKRLCCAQDSSRNTFLPACSLNQTGKSLPRNILPRRGQCGKACVIPSVTSVLGGVEADLGEFPWAVLLGYKIKKRTRTRTGYKLSDVWRWKCGGTLINSWYVLTAAHCHDSTNRIQKVVLGERRVGTDPDCPRISGRRTSLEGCLPNVQEKAVARVIVHENYERHAEAGLLFDIALVRMETEAELNQAVQLACLPVDIRESSQMIGASNLGLDLEGRDATVIGWGQIYNYHDGYLESFGVSEKYLQKLKISVVSEDDCKSLLRNRNITRRHLCAGLEIGKDSCKGDSGGGLFIGSGKKLEREYLQIGLVSYGSRTCGIGKPGVYTRITQYMDWIHKNLEP